MQNQHLNEKELVTTPRISLLAEHLIDQIKAGEVIESPANMAKELIENAIDAKAKKITLKIKNDPLEYFSIIDDGHGIHPKDLHLVFARHATSKIHDYQDIYQLHSYGFRGEALASLGSIAKVQVKTKTEEDETYMLTNQYGILQPVQKTADINSSSGTEITVTNLYANTPARLKFIQNKLTELQKFRRIIHAFILAYPDITWDLHDDNDFSRYPKNDIELRKHTFLLSSQITVKELSYKNTHVSLWIDLRPQKKRNNLNQFIYVNNRLIHFSLLHSIIIKYLGFSPSYALFITTLQHNIDINVHPAKTEVKFLDRSTILSLVSSLLKSIPVKENDTLDVNPSKKQENNLIEKPIPFQLHESLEQSSEYCESVLEDIIFLKTQDKISHVLNIEKLLLYFLQQTIHDVSAEQVLLLVTQPIQYALPPQKKKILLAWEAFGLKVHNQQDSILQLQALPKGWILTNYERLVCHLLDNEILPKSLVSLTTFLPKEKHKHIHKIINFSSLNALLDFLNRDKLKEHHILLPIEDVFFHEK